VEHDLQPESRRPAAQAGPSGPEIPRLYHRLNNQLGIILANAELLESRLTDETHKARAGQVITSALEAIATVQHLRRATGTPDA
jgi:hypothetical protein